MRRPGRARPRLTLAVATVLILGACGGPAGPREPAASARPQLVGPLPASLALEAELGEDALASVRIENLGDARLDYAIGDLPAWLRAGPSASGALAAGSFVDVALRGACDAGASAGRRSAVATLVSNDPNRGSTPLPVELVCTTATIPTPEPPLDPPPAVSVTAEPAELALDLGDADPELVVEAGGPWTLASDAAWATPAPTSGTAGTTPVTVVLDAGGLTGGIATTALRLVGPSGEEQLVPLTLRLPDIGEIAGAPVELVARPEGAATGVFAVGNLGSAPLRLQATPSAGWFSVEPRRDEVLPGTQISFQVTASCSADAGVRRGRVELVSDDPDEPRVGVDVELVCEPPPPPAFEIEVVYFGATEPTASERQAFEAAAARWSEVIVGDLADVAVPSATALCRGTPAWSGTIDDVLVFAAVTDIDGPGNVVARAGPCQVRSGSLLPYAGVMEFDQADLANIAAQGLLEDTILHEMGHVLGFGTLWEFGRDLVQPDCPASSEPRFVGAFATLEHGLAGGDGSPHVETDGGGGTACGHWDEERYGAELMTGYLDAGMALSAITVGSLGDLGYQVDVSAADPYRVPAAGALRSQGRGIELREILIVPELPLSE